MTASLVSLKKNNACLSDWCGECFERFLNYNKNLTKWLQSNLCDPGFQHVTDADTISSTVKPNEDEEKQGKEEQNSEHVGHNVVL